FRQMEVKVFAGYKDKEKAGNAIKALEIRKEEIRKSKTNAHKDYLNRKIEENTYNGLKQRYDRELFELEEEIDKLRKGASK
ncbi:MAG: hypothetical protein JSV63_01640, partial [Candidatus Aenigmatarchaeota archaeon]